MCIVKMIYLLCLISKRPGLLGILAAWCLEGCLFSALCLFHPSSNEAVRKRNAALGM